MKFAAIDIGSNAIRLLIARPLNLEISVPNFKPVEVTRLPLRLGDDVFKTKSIASHKEDLLIKAMIAFQYLTEIYNVDKLKAVATSAMRDANNAQEIIEKIWHKTGIKIEIISGLQESELLQNTILTTVTNNNTFLHIDVGGGSTELTVIRKKKVIAYESFNIGTVRMLENAVDKQEQIRMKKWLQYMKLKNENMRAIGTGGNIVKLNSLGNPSQKKPLSFSALAAINQEIINTSIHDRIYQMGLNPDRAQVIDSAGKIFIDILSFSNINKIIAPNKGLKDGIILSLWQEYFNAQ